MINFSQIAKIVGNLPKMKEQMEQLRGKLGTISAEGTAGGGMVTVKANGHLELVSCTISDEAMQDKELLEGLIKSAANQALQKCREMVAQETSEMTGLPGGMEFPGSS